MTTSSFAYLQRRLEPQEQWHNDKARWNKRLFYTVEVATLLAGAAIPVVNLWAVKDTYLAALLSAILGGIVVVAAAVGKLFKFHDNWLHYRAVVEALGREKELYSVGAGDYAAPLEEEARNRQLAERVENLLATGTSQFVATHQAAEKGTDNSVARP
ncbi:MAG: DUF4231 domain-containing protein [Chthoniobacterales bacterium]|nr:DUF4231 domain-containing protein [Chthoniobacterales bacterium]